MGVAGSSVTRWIATAVAIIAMLGLAAIVGRSIFRSVQNEIWVLRSEVPLSPELESRLKGVLRERAANLHPAFSPILRSSGPGEFTLILRGEQPPAAVVARVLTRRGLFEVFAVERILRQFSADVSEIDVQPNQKILRGLGEPSTMVIVDATAIIQGDVIRDAWVEMNEGDRPVVMLGLWPAGRDPLREFTREHIGERLALVVDDRVQAVPEIRAPFSDLLQIDPGWGRAQASAAVELAAILKAGELPVPAIVAKAPETHTAHAP